MSGETVKYLLDRVVFRRASREGAGTSDIPVTGISDFFFFKYYCNETYINCTEIPVVVFFKKPIKIRLFPDVCPLRTVEQLLSHAEIGVLSLSSET